MTNLWFGRKVDFQLKTSMSNALIKSFFKSVDPLLYPYVVQVNYERWLGKARPSGSSDFYFSQLCEDIIGQQLSGKAADTILGRFEVLLEKKVTPERVLEIKDEEMRNVGMSWAKAKYVKNIAVAFIEGGIDAMRLHTWDDEVVIEHLTAIKGVGRWTAEMFLMFTLGRENVFSYGDLGLRRGIEKVYGLANPDRKAIEPIVEKWSPYKSYGSIALWQSLAV
jgi:DNA-3-methyladenine glycosylase II